ncbi:MAG: hypothetical protein RR065_09095 [Clostridia bacterium]
MKKIIGLLLSLALTLALPLAAFGEQSEIDTELEGLVTALVEGGFLMEDIDIGSVMLNVDEQTMRDGILTDGEIEVGQYVLVQYDGRLTRSLPPQAHADRVGCYVLTGTAGEFLEGGVMLEGDALFGKVYVHMDSTMAHVYPNVPMTVYYDGIMALSQPGQVNARYVVVPKLEGIVSEQDVEGFTLTASSGESYRVQLNMDTLMGALLDAEDADALEETEAANEDAAPAEDKPELAEDEAESAENEVSEPTLSSPSTMINGDLVTVYYNGVMTKSIPGQVNALEVLVHR